MKSYHPSAKAQAMTLLETVIAIGVIGFAVPMILSGTTASLTDRTNAEADTRSAWIAQDLEQQINALWATPRQFSSLPTSLSLNFPVIGTKASPLVFIYDGQGKFLKLGTATDLRTGSKDQAARYLVTLHSTAHNPFNFTTNTGSSNSSLSRVFITVEYPAKAALTKRQSNLFTLLKTQQNF